VLSLPSPPPQLPLPVFTRNPLEPGCEEEGAIVCHNGHIKGQQARGAEACWLRWRVRMVARDERRERA
jgi:hypothetical protein